MPISMDRMAKQVDKGKKMDEYQSVGVATGVNHENATPNAQHVLRRRLWSECCSRASADCLRQRYRLRKASWAFFFGTPAAMVALDSRLNGRDATSTQAGPQYPARLAAFPVGTAQESRNATWHQTGIDESRHQVNSGLVLARWERKSAIARPGEVLPTNLQGV